MEPAPTEPSPSDKAADKRLSDVVVTASKREERAQDVPSAITTASAEQISEQSLATSNDVERISPNLSAQSSGNRASKPRWFLRGIGSNDPSVNLEAPVGIYQDEVFIAWSTPDTLKRSGVKRRRSVRERTSSAANAP